MDSIVKLDPARVLEPGGLKALPGGKKREREKRSRSFPRYEKIPPPGLVTGVPVLLIIPPPEGVLHDPAGENIVGLPPLGGMEKPDLDPCIPGF